MRDLIIQKAREAEELAAHSTDGSATREGWMRVAHSWRLIADRLLADPSGDDEATIVILF